MSCKKKMALIHELRHFMTVLEEWVLFLVYCLAVNKFIYGKEAGSYETFY